MLEVEGLTKSYLYGYRALSHLSFTVNDGETLAVFAEQEGGKTSLLKCLAGILHYEEGRIFLDGKDLKAISPKERAVRMIYEDGGLLRGRKVSENLNYPLRLRGIPKKERKRTVKEILERMGIGHLESEYPSYLYPDDAIRVAFSRLYLSEERLAVADNPFALLTGIERENLFRELSPLLTGRTAVFATDSLSEAFSVGGRILILHFGTAAGYGTKEDLYARPSTLYTAKLLYPYLNLSEWTDDGWNNAKSVLWMGIAEEGEEKVEGVFSQDGIYYHLYRGNYYASEKRLSKIRPVGRQNKFYFDGEEKLSAIACENFSSLLK